MYICEPHNICTMQNFSSKALIKKQRVKYLKSQKEGFVLTCASNFGVKGEGLSVLRRMQRDPSCGLYCSETTPGSFCAPGETDDSPI